MSLKNKLNQNDSVKLTLLTGQKNCRTNEHYVMETTHDQF